MKQISVNILCSTAVTLLLLAIAGILFGARYLLISGVLQAFFVNIVIHFGLCVTHRFECSFAVLEWMLDIGYTEVVVILFGAVFNWYDSTPVWLLAIMTIIAYVISIFLNIIQMRQEIAQINALLQKRSKR